jgi:response regulator NasT
VSKSLSVLIAEDEALIRLDLKEMLEEEGYLVAGEAGDGASAVDLAQKLRPDLIIMDVKMPGLDGISAAAQISEQRLAPVVILTAFSQHELVRRASEAGAMAYLVKPFTKADLVPAIEVAVSRFQEIAALDSEVAGLRDRLEVRKLLDRAKGLLQAERGITEADAFRWIQKTSMDRRLTMRAVAEEIIAASQPPAPDTEPGAEASAGTPNAPADAAPASSPSQSGSAQPGSAQPGSAQPGSAQPGSAQPGSAQPGSAQPGSAQSGSAQPGPGDSTASQPGADQSGSGQSGSGQSGPGRPGPAAPHPPGGPTQSPAPRPTPGAGTRPEPGKPTPGRPIPKPGPGRPTPGQPT